MMRSATTHKGPTVSDDTLESALRQCRDAARRGYAIAKENLRESAKAIEEVSRSLSKSSHTRLAHFLPGQCRGNPMWLPWGWAATQGRPYTNGDGAECTNLLWSDLEHVVHCPDTVCHIKSRFLHEGALCFFADFLLQRAQEFQ
jgi:hypothetical protein